jgi:hypothetical protein
MKDLEIKQMDSKREMEVMVGLDQVRATNARINKAGRELNPDEILKLVHREEETGMETEEERSEREDAEAAKRAFQGANGETVRRIGEGSPTGEAEYKISPVSLLQNRSTVQVFAKPTIRKRKESGMNALGIVKKKTKLI